MESFGQNMNGKQMAELLELLASEAHSMDTVFSLDRSTVLSPHYYYQSCIKHEGRPILPPVMSEDRRFEMQMHKQQAVMVEARLRAQSRQKLLARVQSVMSGIERKHRSNISDSERSVTSSDDEASKSDAELAVEASACDKMPDPMASTPQEPPESGIESKADTVVMLPGASDKITEDGNQQPDKGRDEDAFQNDTGRNSFKSSGSGNSTMRKSVVELVLNAKAQEEQSVKSERENESDVVTAAADIDTTGNNPCDAQRDTAAAASGSASGSASRSASGGEQAGEDRVCSEVLANVVHSSAASSETSDASEEMCGTVIANTDSSSRECKDSPAAAAAADRDTEPGAVDPTLRLLSRVDFSDDTPVSTPARKTRPCEEEDGEVSPGPMTTPSLSDISHDESVASEEPQTADLNTESTALDKYMAASCEQTLSSHTTLPHIQQQLEEMSKDHTVSDVSSLHNTADNITPRSNQSNEEQTVSKTVCSHDATVTSRVLNQSFTLSHPSPVLLAAEAKKSQTNSSRSAASSGGQRSVRSRSSIEELQQQQQQQQNSKAQRKLVYHAECEESGKEQHLQRYLQAVHQMSAEAQETQHSDDDVRQSEHVYDTLMAQFEEQRQKLLEEQQQQLAVFLADQHRQQMLFQQEILSLEKQTLANSGLSLDHSALLLQQRDAGMSQQHGHEHASQNCAHDSKQSHAEGPASPLQHQSNLLTPQRSRTPPRKGTVTAVPPSPMAEKQKQRYDTWLRAPAPSPPPPQHSMAHNIEEHRPVSAPAHKVSFHIDGKSHSPAGVFYDPPPLPGNVSFSEQPRQSFEQFPSPAVLKRTQEEVYEELAALDSRQKLPVSSSSPAHNNAPVSILKKSPQQLSSPQENGKGAGKGKKKAATNGTHIVGGQTLPADVHAGFCKMSAAVRGYLTRRLLRTERVQNIIATIRDTAEFALRFQQESPVKRGVCSMQDQQLQGRVLAQLDSAMYEIHEIFFLTATADQMAIIQQDRSLLMERKFKAQTPRHSAAEVKKVSAATQKALERKKKMLIAESRVFGGEPRPKSAPPANNNHKPATTDHSGAIYRHYQQLMNKSVKAAQSRHRPVTARSARSETPTDHTAQSRHHPSTARQPLTEHTAPKQCNKSAAAAAAAETKKARKVHSRTAKPAAATASSAPAKKAASIPAAVRKVAKGVSAPSKTTVTRQEK